MKKLDIAIIGAGTAGLSAASVIKKHTENFSIFHDGPHGTTCARVGCMPSKVLIQIANDLAHSKKFEKMGIHGANHLSIDTRKAMAHVQSLRDRFVRGVLSSVENYGDKIINKRVRILSPNRLIDSEGKEYHTNKIIIATGSSPIIPAPWKEFKDHFVTTDQFFEMKDLPKSMAVIGLGVIGLELGQALHRLGIKVTGFSSDTSLGGLTDPEVRDYTFNKFSEEMNIKLGRANIIGYENNLLKIEVNGEVVEVEKALISIGRSPNITDLGLENLGVTLDAKAIPEYNTSTMQVGDLPVFWAGDVNGFRPILHEAADEGRIAAVNSLSESVQCFQRRSLLAITFSDPNIAVVGKSHKELSNENLEFVTGKVSFEGQGRSIVKLKEVGRLHIFVQKSTGKILGAEMFGPDNEHIAHLLSWVIQLDKTVDEVLRLPFYHPVIEEGLRTALRDASSQTDINKPEIEMAFCEDPPAGSHCSP